VDSIHDYENSKWYSEREKAVLMLADKMCLDSQGMLDEKSLTRLREHFDDSQILELGSYFSIVTGFQKFNTVFNVLYACEI
jgi:alkylhydroperoxidase family enzyme